MNGILEHIAEKTSGKAYKSFRYCYDKEVNVPTVAYDDHETYILKRGQIAESDKDIKQVKKLADYAKELSKVKPLFSYFLDGSRRVYKIDDIQYQNRLFPVLGGQIGVACCIRPNRESFSVKEIERLLVLSLPSLSTTREKHRKQFLDRLTKEINQHPRLTKFGLKFDEILQYNSDQAKKDVEEYMKRGTATIQDKMTAVEKSTVALLTQKRFLDVDNYLIKDGSLQYSNPPSDMRELAKYKENFRRVVGVSKSFNPELTKDIKSQSNAAKIASLEMGYRTVAYRYSSEMLGDVEYAIWYVRIREKARSVSPFAGVLKLEKILVTDDEKKNGIDSEEIDLITAHIINERNPVCYGKDERWANHLYPVFLTETFVKSKYLSDLHFINLF
ncbi:MAG: hypothetical protein LUM44_21175 [Pyrinomonadaceae bacterium]|nr:hypothetical protein [Pyrinomonadaceae bacterium]